MSIFASRERRTLSIPFDPPNEVTIQKLSGKQLERASKAFLGAMIADVQERGGSRVMKDMQELWKKPDTGAQVEEVQGDPLNGYDKHVLIQGGIKSWTYPESLAPVQVTETNRDGHAVQVMAIAPAIEDLSDEAVDWFATEILKLTKPSAFLAPDEKVSAQVKD